MCGKSAISDDFIRVQTERQLKTLVNIAITTFVYCARLETKYQDITGSKKIPVHVTTGIPFHISASSSCSEANQVLVRHFKREIDRR